MFSHRKPHSNFILSPHGTPGDHNSHHAALAYDGPIVRSSQDLTEQPWFESINKVAWISKTGDADDGVIAELKQGALGQREQVEAVCGDILAQLSRLNLVACRCQLAEKLCVEQMHLSQIGLRRIPRNPRAMLNGCASMRITLDAPSCHQCDLVDRGLAELVFGVAADGDNEGAVLVE